MRSSTTSSVSGSCSTHANTYDPYEKGVYNGMPSQLDPDAINSDVNDPQRPAIRRSQLSFKKGTHPSTSRTAHTPLRLAEETVAQEMSEKVIEDVSSVPHHSARRLIERERGEVEDRFQKQPSSRQTQDSASYDELSTGARWDWRRRAVSQLTKRVKDSSFQSLVRDTFPQSKRVYRRREASASLKRGDLSVLERRRELEFLAEVRRRHGPEIERSTRDQMLAVRERAKRQRQKFIEERLQPYVERWKYLLNKETQEQRNEVAKRRVAPLSELRSQGLVITGLEGYWLTTRNGKGRVKQFGQRIGQFSTSARGKLEWNKFRKGDQIELRPAVATGFNIASLLPKGSRADLGWHESDVDNQRFIPATIHAMSSTEVRLSFEKGFQELDLLACPAWRIDLGYNDLIERRVNEALQALSHDFEAISRADILAREGSSELELSGSALVPDIIREEPRTTSIRQCGLFDDDQLIHSWIMRYSRPNPIEVEGDPLLSGLSEIQTRAVALMLSVPLSLVQGPPGTGKTTTIVAAVKLLKAHFQVPHPILITSHTNVAVDNLAATCAAAGLKVVRAGSFARARQGLEAITLDSLMEAHPLQARLEELSRNISTLKRALADLEAQKRRRSIGLATSTQDGIATDTLDMPRTSGQECNLWRDDINFVADAREYPSLEKPQEEVVALRWTIDDISFLKRRLATIRSAFFLTRKEMETDVFRGADVVCCTALSVPTCKSIDFPFVFFDEGSMATEPVTLVPLVKGSRQLAIIGDHRQLPPVVEDEQARRGGLAKSLFERLIERGDVPSLMLDSQHRMHPSLSAFVSKNFYNSELRDGDKVAAVKSFSSSYRSSVSDPAHAFLVFVDHCFPESSWQKSIENHGEALICGRVIADLLARNSDLQAHDIGVVTPYRGQAQYLSRALAEPRSALRIEMARYSAQMTSNGFAASMSECDPSKIEVHTVDGFEGREKKAVVFSTTRSNRGGYVGFLADSRRLNVALTRAQRGLWVVGNLETLRGAHLGEAGHRSVEKADVQVVRRFVEHLESERCIVNAGDVVLRK